MKSRFMKASQITVSPKEEKKNRKKNSYIKFGGVRITSKFDFNLRCHGEYRILENDGKILDFLLDVPSRFLWHP